MDQQLFETFFHNTPAAFSCQRVIRDNAGLPCAFEVIDKNQAYESLMESCQAHNPYTAPGEPVPGEAARPDHNPLHQAWMKVMSSQQPVEFDAFYPRLQKWLRTHCFPLGISHFGCFYQDTTREHDFILELETFMKVNVDLLCVVDIDGWLIKVNQRFQDVLGYRQDELEAANIRDFIVEADWPETARTMRTLAGQNPIMGFQNRYRCKDGSLRFFSWQAQPIGRFIYASARDITNERAIEQDLRLSEEKYRLITEYASDVIWILNLSQDRFVFISPAVYQLRGLTVEEAMNQTMDESLSPDSAQQIHQHLGSILQEFVHHPDIPTSYVAEVQQSCKDGSLVWIEISVRFRFNADSEIEAVGVSRNIENRKKLEREARFLSEHDQLTGLYNRYYYEDSLIRLERQDYLPLTLIMADVNGLKLTNDAFGHRAGDRLLVAFAEILKVSCRPGDIIARIGGDEFVILMTNTSAEQAEQFIARLTRSIATTGVERGMLSVSFGWRTRQRLAEGLDTIYKLAEDAMYRHKLLESKSHKNNTLRLITQSLFEKDPFEQRHGERVSDLCLAIGTAMDLPKDMLNDLKLAGLFHDIGKIGVDEKLLNKRDTLTQTEIEDIQRHPEIGYQILRSVSDFVEIAEYVLSHHERPDGTGYPRGLSLDKIPLLARIISVADAFDLMTRDTSYRQGISMAAAVEELHNNAGSQFDPAVVRILTEKVLAY